MFFFSKMPPITPDRWFPPVSIALILLLTVAELRAEGSTEDQIHQEWEPTVVLIMNDGSSVAGRIVTESDETITVLTKTDGQIDIDSDDIAQRVALAPPLGTESDPTTDSSVSRDGGSAEDLDEPKDSCPEFFGGDLEIPVYARAERCKGGDQSIVFWVHAPVPYRRALLDYYRAWTRLNGWRGGIQPCVGTFTGDMCEWKKDNHRLTLTVQPTGYSTLLVRTK